MDERLTFSGTVEVLFTRGMGPKLTNGLKARLRADGLDLDRPLLPAYPAGKVADWIELALPEAFPSLARDEALRELGRTSVASYGDTIVGKGLVMMLKLLGLRRILERMTRAMRTGGNYLDTKCTVHGPTDVELWINDVNGMPTYFLGMLEAMTAMCGVRDPAVVLVGSDGRNCTLRVQWTE